MLGKTGKGPTVYGRGTGRMKKCFGCLVGCGHEPPRDTQRAREKVEIRHHLLVEMNEVMDDAVR